jgi:2'-hydroxyisoflavone reductase
LFNAAGPVVPLAEHLATARAVAGHRGEVVAASSDWLERQGVRHWSGERSLPLWLPAEDAGFMARSTAAAQAAGLTCRPLAQTLEATLEWELSQGPGRPRKAGLSAVDEAALLLAARQ